MKQDLQHFVRERFLAHKLRVLETFAQGITSSQERRESLRETLNALRIGDERITALREATYRAAFESTYGQPL